LACAPKLELGSEEELELGSEEKLELGSARVGEKNKEKKKKAATSRRTPKVFWHNDLREWAILGSNQ
jgi:hypothetical protein